MPHEMYWITPDRLLYVSYQGHQTPDTLKETLDAMAEQLDTVSMPVSILINWREVTSAEPHVLMSQMGHRAYSHPMAAYGLLVGFPAVEKFQNQVAAAKTRGTSNTMYFQTMEQAQDYLRIPLPMLKL